MVKESLTLGPESFMQCRTFAEVVIQWRSMRPAVRSRARPATDFGVNKSAIFDTMRAEIANSVGWAFNALL